MSDVWEQVLAGEYPTYEEEPGATPQDSEPPPDGAEAPQQAPAGQPADEDAWEPRILGAWEDTSSLTDEQVLRCMALVQPPHLFEDRWTPTREVVARVGKAFVGRKYPVPVRRPNREWKAEKRTLSMEDFNRHFAGKHLLGAYLVDDEGRTGVALADIDATKEGGMRERLLEGDYMALIDLMCATRVVGGIMAGIFASGVYLTLTGGKGAHAIHVLGERSAAAIVRRQMRWGFLAAGLERISDIRHRYDDDFDVEYFPKQDEAGDGLGNLVRLPHGVDPGTGRPALALLPDWDRRPECPVDPMYRDVPATASERSRWEIQAAVDGAGGSLPWVEAVLGNKYTPMLRERCEALLAKGDPQMRNAVGQVIHMAGWADPMMSAGLLTDLEAVAETL